MKLLFCIPHLATGGAERVMSLLANKFVSNGNDVEIVLLSSDRRSYQLDSRVKLSFAGADGRSSLIRRMKWLRRTVKQNHPDVVVVFLVKAYCMTLLSLLGTKIPVIASERNDPRFTKPLLWNMLSFILLPSSAHFVVQTQRIKDYYPFFFSSFTSIILNPVTDTVFDVKPTKKEKIIVTAGRLYPQKNHILLIKAFKSIYHSIPDYCLHIYGDGPCKENLEQLIIREGLENHVILKGRSDNVIEELNKATLFCLSSDYEGMSNSLIEAFCLGLPIVTTNVSGVETFIKDGRNALVVSTGDTDAFASAIYRLISNEQLREEMGERNKREGVRFNIDLIYNEWNSLLLTILGKK